MLVSKLWQAMFRAAAALLLMGALASPALAEIGCARGCAEEVQTSLSASEDGADQSVSNGQPQEQQEQGAPRGHCAFNHGHCTAIPVTGAAAKAVPPEIRAYGAVTAATLAPASIDTPVRPPNA